MIKLFVIKIIAHFRGLNGGHLFEGLALIRGGRLIDNLVYRVGAYARVGAYSREALSRSITVSVFVVRLEENNGGHLFNLIH